MTQKAGWEAPPPRRTRRRGNLPPLNQRKKLGPKSPWRGVRKRKRGQG